MPNRTLQDLLRGRGAHVDPVDCIGGLSSELAGKQFPGAEYTIWQLVWHMNYWMEYELRSLDGPEMPYPPHAAESWPPEAAPASESSWQIELERSRRQVDQLAAWARRAGLEAIGAKIVHRDRGETIQEVLWQMVAHNSYHTGQVALLRRALGAWPPAGGGDTW
jgi:uncharacterized damage-inducible protein DinB